MKSKAFANFTLTYLPTIGMIIFLAIFLGVCFVVLRKKNKQAFEQASKIPLDERSE